MSIAAKVYDTPFKDAVDRKGISIKKDDAVTVVHHDHRSGTRVSDVGVGGVVLGFNRSGRVLVSSIPNPVRPDALEVKPHVYRVSYESRRPGSGIVERKPFDARRVRNTGRKHKHLNRRARRAA